MNDETIAEQIERACQTALIRHRQSLHEVKMLPQNKGESEVLDEQFRLAFLGGMNLGASFLVRADGEATPQQLERALKIVGDKYGYILGLNNPR